MTAFTDPSAVARYTDAARRKVPGLDNLHRMTHLLLAEAAGPTAQILVLGAGGGMELTALALAQPGWTFTGVDPSAEMLTLAAQTLGPAPPCTTAISTPAPRAPSMEPPAF